MQLDLSLQIATPLNPFPNVHRAVAHDCEAMKEACERVLAMTDGSPPKAGSKRDYGNLMQDLIFVFTCVQGVLGLVEAIASGKASFAEVEAQVVERRRIPLLIAGDAEAASPTSELIVPGGEA